MAFEVQIVSLCLSVCVCEREKGSWQRAVESMLAATSWVSISRQELANGALEKADTAASRRTSLVNLHQTCY